MSIRISVLAVAAALLGGCNFGASGVSSQKQDSTELALIKAGEFSHYPAGDYLRNGNPVSPTPHMVRFEHDFQIMARHVSQAEYAACVSDGACKRLDKAQRDAISPDLPAVGISWRDATAYAAWLSARTGQNYRLPTYAEWVFAAGSAYKEEVIVDAADPNDPAQRWIAEYELETRRKASVDAKPKPFGTYGMNEAGLKDVAGNVWDWTDTCHARRHLDVTGDVAMPLAENCGIRVVAGRHRSYISDFIRDPKGGACSVGVPPSNLGLRLVLDTSGKGAGVVQSLRSKLGIS
ncbi:SUMF1/EgtB/PvdO family nonheme iron enzyme [Alcaligenaceae bacterium]|nr:SUMF1/EgtB/PvdO family nonheme iron enzyme [Alcaligenaceae bacterium]